MRHCLSHFIFVYHKNLFSQWRHPTYSLYFPAFPDYGFYSGPGDQRGAPCSFADYATMGPHTGQMLQSEHVTSNCTSPSQHHPSPDHFKSSGVYGIFCPRHVLLLTLVLMYWEILLNFSSFQMYMSIPAFGYTACWELFSFLFFQTLPCVSTHILHVKVQRNQSYLYINIYYTYYIFHFNLSWMRKVALLTETKIYICT